MIVTYDPPREPAPIKTAAELFQHVPKALAAAETERQKLEEKLAVISAKEQEGARVAEQFSTLLRRRDAMAQSISIAEAQRAGFVKSLEGASEGIFQRIGDTANEGLLVRQAGVMASWRETILHIVRFVEIRSAKLEKLETELQAFAKANGIDYPVK